MADRTGNSVLYGFIGNEMFCPDVEFDGSKPVTNEGFNPTDK